MSFDFGGGKRGEVSDWYAMPEPAVGLKIKVDRYKPKGKKMYIRLIAKCPEHHDCSKKRNISHNGNFGKIEPVAYLCAWSDLRFGIDRDDHASRHLRVPVDRVHEYAASLNGRVDVLLDRY